MKLVVIFGQSLVFLLKRYQRLLVKLLVVAHNTELVLQFLVAFSGLKEVGHQTLDQLSAVDVEGQAVVELVQLLADCLVALGCHKFSHLNL